MADNLFEKLSLLERINSSSTPLNDTDISLVSRYGNGIFTSYSVTLNDLRAALERTTVFATPAAGLASTTQNQIFYVYSDSTQLYLNAYYNRVNAFELITDDNNVGKLYPSAKCLAQRGSYYEYGNAPLVPSFAALRTLPVTREGQRVKLGSYSSATVLGGGEFIGHLGTAVDDGGITAAGSGYYWTRVLPHSDFIDLNYWGTPVGGDISDPIIAAVAAAKALGITVVQLPGTAYNAPFIVSKKIDIDLTDAKPIFILGNTKTKIGTTLLSTYKDGPLFYFHRNYALSTYFWTTGGIEGITINADVTIRPSATAAAIQISDVWGFIVNKIRIINFTYGNGLILRNETAWTEGTKISDLDIRSTQLGIVCTLDVNSTTATNSFFGTKIEQYSFQAGTGLAGTTGLSVGTNETVAASKECRFYGSELTMRAWPEGGGYNFGLRVRSFSTVGDCDIKIIPDGVGLSASDTVTATPFKCIAVEAGGTYYAKTSVMPYQGTYNCLKLSYLNFALESAFTYDRAGTTNNVLKRGFPMVNPKGLNVKCYEELTIAQQVAGLKVGLFNLPVGVSLRVVLRSFYSTVPTSMKVSSYIVNVNGAGLFTTVAPENTDILNVLTTTSATVSGTSVLTGASIAASRSRLNDFVDTTTAYNPKVINGNTTQINKDGLGSDTRDFYVSIPANVGASDTLCVSCEIEFI